MAVTASEVATIAGVDRSVVSRVINGARGNSRVSPEVAKRVRRIADSLGYRPHAGARAVRNGRFGAVGLLLSTVGARSNPAAGIICGIQRDIIGENLHLQLAELPDEALTNEGYVPKVLLELSVDGLIINYTHQIPQPLVDMIYEHSIPAVWTNTKLDRNCVHPDDLEAGVNATRHLREHGHERIVYYANASQIHYSFADRFAGYARVMSESALPAVSWTSTADGPPGESLRRAEDMLSRDDRPTGLVCYSHVDATTAMFAALRLGLNIPEDLSVVAIGAHVDHSTGMTMDTVLLPFEEVGRIAAVALRKRIANPENIIETIAVPSTLVSGETVMPPR